MVHEIPHVQYVHKVCTWILFAVSSIELTRHPTSISFVLIFSSSPISPKWPLLFTFPAKNFVRILFYVVHVLSSSYFLFNSAKILRPYPQYLYLIVVVEFECSRDTESYAGGSVATGRATHAGQVKG
jgi:hypothetical protein